MDQENTAIVGMARLPVRLPHPMIMVHGVNSQMPLSCLYCKVGPNGILRN